MFFNTLCILLVHDVLILACWNVSQERRYRSAAQPTPLAFTQHAHMHDGAHMHEHNVRPSPIEHMPAPQSFRPHGALSAGSEVRTSHLNHNVHLKLTLTCS